MFADINNNNQQVQQEVATTTTTALLSEAELSQLQELTTELNDARGLLQQTTEAADKQELTVMIEELEENILAAITEIAQVKLGIRVNKNAMMVQQQNTNNNNTPPAAAAHHLMKWDDGKLYACDITSLFFEANEIRCTVRIPGFPENNKKNEGKGEIVSLERNIIGAWDQKTAFVVPPTPQHQNEQNNNNNALLTAPPPNTKILAGTKCFAVDFTPASKLNPDNQIFIPVIVERLTMHGTVCVQPIPSSSNISNNNSSSSNNNNNANVGFDSYATTTQQQQQGNAQTSSFEIPLTHVRPYCLPPPQGKMLRKRWENLTQEERHQILEEKKKKQNEQQEQKRRQRTETISQQANDWQKMKALMGGRKF